MSFDISVQSNNGRSFSDRDKVKSIIRTNLSAFDGRQVDIYPMDGERLRSFGAGSERRFIIFTNQATTSENENKENFVADQPVIINNVIKFQEFLPAQGLATQIFADDGTTIIAEYDQRYNELYVLIPLMTDGAEEDYDIFEYIVKQVNELVFKVKHLRFSWKHTSDKVALTDGINKQLKETVKREVERAKQMYEEAQNNERYYREELKKTLDNIVRKQREYTQAQERYESAEVSVDEQLDLIVGHPKVLDLHIKNNKYIVFTDEIYAYDKHNFRYHIGKMRIEFDPRNTDVKFFGEHKPVGRGYWGSDDPHPHVSGSGSPCLGSVSATVAELCHAMELYALTLTLIDYLENVNIDDPAGKMAMHYDRVDEEGNITAKGGTYRLGETQISVEDEESIAPGESNSDGTRARCYHDEEMYDIGDMNFAYYDYDEDGEGTGGRWVHDENVHENHSYDNRIEAYVHDDNYDGNWEENNADEEDEESDVEEVTF